MSDRQLDTLREDVHKAILEGGFPCGALCDDVSEFLIEMGWRHPGITESETESAAGPAPIPLPPEPPRDRVIEAVDADGTVPMRWSYKGDWWQVRVLTDSEWSYWTYDWTELIESAMRSGWSLRHVAAEGGES